MVPQRAPYLALDRPVVELALADQAVGRGRDGILLRRHVQAFDDEEPVASEETTHLRDGCRAGVVLEDAGEGIVRRDDEIEFAVAGKRFEPRADVEDAARLEPLDESLPLGRVVAETHLHKVAAGREHAHTRPPAVPAAWSRENARSRYRAASSSVRRDEARSASGSSSRVGAPNSAKRTSFRPSQCVMSARNATSSGSVGPRHHDA